MTKSRSSAVVGGQRMFVVYKNHIRYKVAFQEWYCITLLLYSDSPGGICVTIVCDTFSSLKLELCVVGFKCSIILSYLV